MKHTLRFLTFLLLAAGLVGSVIAQTPANSCRNIGSIYYQCF